MNTTHDKRFIRGNHTIQTLIEIGKNIWTSQENISEITLDEICSRCEMTKGAFYHHFSSKDAFFEQINSCVLADHMLDIIQSGDNAYPDQPNIQICMWIKGIADYAAHYRKNICLFSRISTLDNRRQTVSPWRSSVQEHLSHWQEQGFLRSDISVQALQDYLDSFTYGTFILTAQQYIQAPHEDAMICAFVETLFNKE